MIVQLLRPIARNERSHHDHAAVAVADPRPFRDIIIDNLLGELDQLPDIAANPLVRGDRLVYHDGILRLV
jgi:hypothetical protein